MFFAHLFTSTLKTRSISNQHDSSFIASSVFMRHDGKVTARLSHFPLGTFQVFKMVYDHSLLWAVLLLGLISGSNLSSASSNTSSHFPISIFADRTGNESGESGLYPLFKNLSNNLGERPTNVSALTSRPPQTLAMHINVHITSPSSTFSSSFGKATLSFPSSAPTTFSSWTSQKFQHTIDSLWPNSSRALADGESYPPFHNSPTSFAVRTPNMSGMTPTKLPSNESQTNHPAAFFTRPANLSGTTVPALQSQDVRNYNNLPSRLMKSLNTSGLIAMNLSSNVLNTSLSRGPWNNDSPYPPCRNSSALVNYGMMNISEFVLNTSLPRSPSQYGSVHPPFGNSSSISVGRPTNVSKPVPTGLLLHSSGDNSDLYPPTDFSNVTIKQNCTLQNLNLSSISRMNVLGRVSRRLSRRQASDNRDLHPQSWISCFQRDAEFFEFSEENIRSSEVIEWYGRWTVEARDKQPQKYTQHGEWRLFYRWWLQEYDFRCGYDFAVCRNAKNREDVQKMYPGEENRSLVRRIYFITLMYDYLHDHTRMMQVS